MQPRTDETTQFDARPASGSQPASSLAEDGRTQGRGHDDTNRARGVRASAKTPSIIGRYEVREQIGAGTFGAVYLCFDPQLKRNVAIKVRHQPNTPQGGGSEELLHEAQSVARLRNPGIVAVLDTGTTDDGRGYIVYEYVEGYNLKQRIDAADFSREDAIRWCAETADALNYAHLQGLVHRDIKPGNILIDRSGHTRLADFGLAKIDDQFFMDDAGRVLGTVAYMSPEQADGKSHWATSQSDIYSLGVVLYELLCGRRPFNSESSIDLLEQVKHRAVPPPRTIQEDIPKPLEEICLHGMAKEPADRFTTAADMAAELRAVLVGPKPRRSVLPYLLAAIAGVVLLAAAVWSLRDRSSDRTDRVDAAPGASANVASTPSGIVAGENPPKLEILLQRRLQVDDFVKLRQADVPIHTGDKVQLHATLEKPGYVYLYWYDAKGKPTRLWPDSGASLDEQQPVSEVWSPAGAKSNGQTAKWWPVEGETGAQLALVAVADKPLAADELQRFEDQNFVLAGELSRPRQMLEFAHPGLSSGTVVRGLGANPVEAPKRVVPELEPELNSRFRAYRGWLFFQEETKP